MALPAMISDFSKQQLNYGMAVGQSLAQLGQQVGQQLAQREYQRQAAEALPAMQESYRKAFDKIQQNDISGGYMDVLNTSMQFGATQNPFLMGYIEQANKFAKEAGDARLSQEWQTIQRGGATGAAMGQTGAEEAESMVTRGIPARNIGEEPLPEPDLNQPIPEAAPLGAGPEPQADTKAQEEFDKLPAYKQAAVQNTGEADMMTPDQRQTYTNESIGQDTGAKKYKMENIDLGNYGINISSIGIPLVGEEVRIKKSVSGATDKPGARVTFSEDIVEVGKEQYDDSKKYVDKLKDAKQKLSSQSPSKDSGTFEQIIKDSGGILNATFIPTENKNTAVRFPYSLIAKSGATPIPITEDVFNAMNEIQKVAYFSNSTGLKLVPKKSYKGKVSVAPAATTPAQRPPLGSFFGVQ